MKIAVLLFGDYRQDGRVQRTANSLAEKYDVKVFITTDDMENYPKVFDGIPIQSVSLKTKKLTNHPLIQIIKFIEYFVSTTKFVKKYNPDIVFCNDVYTLFFGWLFKKNGKRFIYDSHELWKDTMHHYAYNAKLFKLLYWVQKKTIGSADGVITVCNSIADILKEDHKIKRPEVIMNISEMQKCTDTNIIRKRTGIKENKKIVLYVGALSKGRGLENIIESTKEWMDNVVLAILGSGVLENKLKKMVKENGLNEKVYFLGVVPQAEVLEYTNSCNYGIMAIQNMCQSYYYCLPNKFFQTAQNKIPIIASNFPELEKIIKENGLGYTFEPENRSDIADKVNKMIIEDFNISDRNYKKFMIKYNWQNEKTKLFRLIDDLKIVDSGKK